MKRFFTILAFNLVLISSCTKTTNRGIEMEFITDTLLLGAVKDSTFLMDVTSWNAFSHSTGGLVQPGDTSYNNTSEGIKFLNRNFRTGLRLQTKSEINFKNKTIYYKYKVNSSNQVIIAPTLKYNPLTTDFFPQVQGLYFSSFSLVVQYPETNVIQNNVFYYTRIKPLAGTNNYEAVTATGNYDNAGGVVTHRRTIPVYTQSGYISIVFWDNHATDAFAILAECKMLNN